jgi:hypothetical protein
MKQEIPILNYIIWANTRPTQSINNFVVHTAAFYYNETDYKITKFTAANYTSTIKPM